MKRGLAGDTGGVERAGDWSTKAVPDLVAWLRGEVGGFARSAGFEERRVAEVRLAVTEAVTNVVLHAYRHRSEPGSVRVKARSDGALVIVVEDDGIRPQPRMDSPGAGLGLPLMASLAQAVQVERCPTGGTCLTLCFERGVAATL